MTAPFKEGPPQRGLPRQPEIPASSSAQPETLLVTDSLVLLRGRSNPALAESVRRNLQTRLGEPITIWEATKAFPDSEITASIDTSVRDKEVYIVQPTSPVFGPNGEKELSVSESITELKLMARAARAGGAKRIVAILGYYGNSRSDKETQQRQPIHAAITAEELEHCGINMMLTLDLHSPQIKGFWRTGEWIDFSTASVMAPFLQQELDGEIENYAVVAPDYGALERSQNLATQLGIRLEQTGFFPKKRISPTEVRLGALQNARVRGKRVLLVDDIASTGGTLLTAAQALVEKYGATEVDIVVTHGLFVGDAIDKINESPYIKRVFTTNTVDHRQAVQESPKVTVFDTGAHWAEVIHRIHEGKSIRELI